MGYKFKELDKTIIKKSMEKPNFLLKTIPDADGRPKICQLIRYYLEDIEVLGAWQGDATLELHPHIQAPVSYFEVKEIVSAIHYISNLSLPYGEVVEDYLKK
jgi:acetoacetate decarboxylase